MVVQLPSVEYHGPEREEVVLHPSRRKYLSELFLYGTVDSITDGFSAINWHRVTNILLWPVMYDLAEKGAMFTRMVPEGDKVIIEASCVDGEHTGFHKRRWVITADDIRKHSYAGYNVDPAEFCEAYDKHVWKFQDETPRDSTPLFNLMRRFPESIEAWHENYRYGFKWGYVLKSPSGDELDSFTVDSVAKSEAEGSLLARLKELHGNAYNCRFRSGRVSERTVAVFADIEREVPLIGKNM